MCHTLMHQSNKANLPVQERFDGCPFVIRKVNETTFLIREKGTNDEIPHVYAKIYSQSDDLRNPTSVIVLSDTGTGIAVQNSDSTSRPHVWSIKTFLESTINPGGKLPYFVILTHCHFDHIGGLKHLTSAGEQESKTGAPNLGGLGVTTVIASSSLDPSFTIPYKHLQENSLCHQIGSKAPHYKTNVWARDFQKLKYIDSRGTALDLGIEVLHTPGHTPDSLSWYDRQSRTLYIGDHIYQQQSSDTNAPPWGAEEPLPIYFVDASDLFDWWQSTKRLISFVESENSKSIDASKVNNAQVQLGAGHVTATIDAYPCLLRARAFMGRILRDEVPQRRILNRVHWTDDTYNKVGEFSVIAPVALIEKGRQTIPKEEWV